MRYIFCLLPLISLIIGAPAKLSDRKKNLMLKIFGPDTDLERVKRILEEEGGKLGLTGLEYFDGCNANSVGAALTTEEEADFEREMTEAKKMKLAIEIKSGDEVLPTFEKHFPKTYAMFVKRLNIVKSLISRFDENVQKFASNVGKTVLDSLVIASKTSDPLENPLKRTITMVNQYKKYKKLIREYKALSQSSKDAIEKTFCTRGAIRIANVEMQFMAFVTLMSAVNDGDENR